MIEQIDQFFRSDGTLISIPTKSKKKIAVLNIISAKLAPNLTYSETQINEIILNFHEDTAAIRRYMIEYRILDRDNKSNYWLK